MSSGGIFPASRTTSPRRAWNPPAPKPRTVQNPPRSSRRQAQDVQLRLAEQPLALPEGINFINANPDEAMKQVKTILEFLYQTNPNQRERYFLSEKIMGILLRPWKGFGQSLQKDLPKALHQKCLRTIGYDRDKVSPLKWENYLFTETHPNAQSYSLGELSSRELQASEGAKRRDTIHYAPQFIEEHLNTVLMEMKEELSGLEEGDLSIELPGLIDKLAERTYNLFSNLQLIFQEYTHS